MTLKAIAIPLMAAASVYGNAVAAQTASTQRIIDSNARRTDVAAAEGCYDLSRSHWYSMEPVRGFTINWPDSVDAPSDSAHQDEREPPKHIRLLPTPLTARYAGHRPLALEPAGPDRYGSPLLRQRYWGTTSDSVFATWTTGFVVVNLRLRPTHYGMEGVAIAGYDSGPTFYAARVTLLRTRCRI